MRGKTTLIDMGYLVKKADLLVAVCSLFVHVAYAFNTPIIGLYGPQPVWRGAPQIFFGLFVQRLIVRLVTCLLMVRVIAKIHIA